MYSVFMHLGFNFKDKQMSLVSGEINMAFEQIPLRVGGKRPPGVLNISHRGTRAFAPENTLAAIEKAKTFGCPIVFPLGLTL